MDARPSSPDDRASPDDPRVLVVSDDPLARAGLVTLLARHGGLAVADQLGSRDDVPAAASRVGADVVMWDLGADRKAVPERLAGIDGSLPPVLALLPDDGAAIDAIAAGARGVVLRDTDPATLRAALRAVARGLVVLDHAAASAVVPARDRGGERPAEELTARESEVLQQMSAGLPNKTIARRLGISEHTVKFHVNAILYKLGVQGRTEAVVRAARLGLVTL